MRDKVRAYQKPLSLDPADDCPICQLPAAYCPLRHHGQLPTAHRVRGATGRRLRRRRANFLAGVHWLYGSVAALLDAMSGLLPDLDSESGVELKGFTGILGVLAALAVWQRLASLRPAVAFEFHLWAVVLAFVLVRHGLRRFMSRLSDPPGDQPQPPDLRRLGGADLSLLSYRALHLAPRR